MRRANKDSEPKEYVKVPTEDGEVQAEIEPVEIQGEVRKEPVDWRRHGTGRTAG